MDETTTDSGLVVVKARAVVPRDNLPNAGGAGPNLPPVSVGPTSSEGFGNTNVLFNENLPPPPGVQAWSGWPVGWDTPNWQAPNWLVNRTSTVGTCCDEVGRTISTFPPRVKKGEDLLATQPAWTTNPEPELYASFSEWIRNAVNSALVTGEIFLYCTGRDSTGYPVRWANLNPFHVTVNFANGALGYDLLEIRLDPADVLHIKYQAVPGDLRGIGPLDYAARNLLTAASLAKMAGDLADSHGVPWGILTHPGNLRSGQADELRKQYLDASATRGAAPVVLSGGMKLEALSFSPESMALLSLREFDEQRIAAAFGVPPFFVGLPQPGGLNYTSTAMLADLFYRQTLRPMAKNIADAISGWALPRGTNLVFDASEYTTPDQATLLASFAQVATAVPGSITPDDVRRAAGLPLNPDAPTPDPMGVTA